MHSPALVGRRPRFSRVVGLALLSGAALTTLFGSEAAAGITATTGAVNVRAAPTGTLVTNGLESDTNIEVWFESRVASAGSQALDHVGAGLVNSTVIGSLPSPATVNIGEALSYMIHIDQATDAAAINYTGSVTFSAAIVGVWFRAGNATTSLGGSDAQWKSAGMSYGTLASRSWELIPVGTTRNFTISPDLRTITLNQQNGINEVDQIRVLVNPEPSTGLLTGLGVAGLALLVRRRRRRRAALRAAAQ